MMTISPTTPDKFARSAGKFIYAPPSGPSDAAHLPDVTETSPAAHVLSFLNLRGNCTCRGGFTLIELGVVLCLLAIVLTIVIPRYGGFLMRGTTRSEARRLSATARYLSNEASRSGKTHYLNFDLRKDRYWVTVQTGKARAVKESTHLSRTHTLPEGIHIKDVVVHGRGKKSSGSQRVAFYPKGENDEAIVHFSRNTSRGYGKKQFYSLHIKPYSGRCKMYDYYYKGYREKHHKAFM